MDRLKQHREFIKEILREYDRIVSQSPEPGVESVLSFDEEHDTYIWLQTGWAGDERVRGIAICVRLKNQKIWIEEDNTETGIANDLLEKGVPKSDIVLAFHAPETRKLTGFASA